VGVAIGINYRDDIGSASAKARGSTTPAIFVTALFDTFDEAAIKRALTGKGEIYKNLRSLIKSNPEFPYLFGYNWPTIRDVIDKRHPIGTLQQPQKIST
jgi:hypothetical protein